jgi:hypothetical protein
MMYKYIFVYIVLPLIIIIKILNVFFLSETFFPYFFHIHLNILDQVVNSLYAIFGTPCIHVPMYVSMYITFRTFHYGIL